MSSYSQRRSIRATRTARSARMHPLGTAAVSTPTLDTAPALTTGHPMLSLANIHPQVVPLPDKRKRNRSPSNASLEYQPPSSRQKLDGMQAENADLEDQSPTYKQKLYGTPAPLSSILEDDNALDSEDDSGPPVSSSPTASPESNKDVNMNMGSFEGFQNLRAGTSRDSQARWERDQLRSCVDDLQESLLRTTSALNAAINTRDQLISDRDGLFNKMQDLTDLIHTINIALYSEVSSKNRTTSILNSGITTLTHAREKLLRAMEILDKTHSLPL